jgi:alkylhydroperoxidase family enzyme
MTWLPTTAAGTTPLEQVFGVTGAIYERFVAMYRAVWERAAVDPVLLELARLRMAQLLRAEADLRLRHRPAIEAGLDEAKVGALASWPTSALFNESERAVLGFTELYVIDPHAIEDTHCEELHRHLSDAELAAFTLALATFEALARFRLALGLQPPGSELIQVDPVAGALH